MSKYLGVDFGSKRIGLATGDSETKIARPLQTVDATQASVVNDLSMYCRENSIETIVIGLPRGLDGQETAQTKLVREVALQWQDFMPCPIVLEDEAMTSELAKERLMMRGRMIEKGAVDREAAAIILQGYLDRL